MKDLLRALKRLRDFRAWGVKRNVDPWAIRQALIIVMAMDTATALERGVEARALDIFDNAARKKAQAFIESIPKSAILEELRR